MRAVKWRNESWTRPVGVGVSTSGKGWSRPLLPDHAELAAYFLDGTLASNADDGRLTNFHSNIKSTKKECFTFMPASFAHSPSCDSHSPARKPAQPSRQHHASSRLQPHGNLLLVVSFLELESSDPSLAGRTLAFTF